MQSAQRTAESVGVWSASCGRQLAWLRKNESVIPIEPLASARGVVLLVEPREDKNLEFTIRNWMHFVGPRKYGLVVFHGSKNKAFVENILKDSPNAVLQDLGVENLRGQDYSNLMTDADFWRSVPHENVLLVQTDTMCLGGEGLEAVEDCDYVGAPWWNTCPRTGYVFHPSSGPYRPTACSQGWALPELWPELVGNGGLSFRKKSAMIQCCESFRLHSAKTGDPKRPVMVGTDGTNRAVDAEDVFFAVACKRLGKKVATREAALGFAAEEILPLSIRRDTPCCFGLHKIYPYHGPRLVSLVLATSAIEKRIREENE